MHKYKTLDQIFNYYSNKDKKGLENINIVACQHLLEPQLEMFKRFIAFGFLPENIYVIGKVYSTSTSVLADFKKLGVYVEQPIFDGESFDNHHCVSVRNFLQRIKKASTSSIIIIDDGAEVILQSQSILENILFGIEQTSAGFRKIDRVEVAFEFPIINVARSTVKLREESPLIAQKCWDIFESKVSISQPVILIVGLGAVGGAMSQLLEEKGFQVHGFDKAHGHQNLLRHIREVKPDIIIGATGENILTKDEIVKLESMAQKKMIFFSVSSSDREFDISEFRKESFEIHKDIAFGKLIFLNNGFPLNFQGARNANTPKEMEPTMALLLGSLLYGVTENMSSVHGLVDVPEEVINIIQGD